MFLIERYTFEVLYFLFLIYFFLSSSSFHLLLFFPPLLLHLTFFLLYFSHPFIFLFFPLSLSLSVASFFLLLHIFSFLRLAWLVAANELSPIGENIGKYKTPLQLEMSKWKQKKNSKALFYIGSLLCSISFFLFFFFFFLCSLLPKKKV